MRKQGVNGVLPLRLFRLIPAGTKLEMSVANIATFTIDLSMARHFPSLILENVMTKDKLAICLGIANAIFVAASVQLTLGCKTIGHRNVSSTESALGEGVAQYQEGDSNGARIMVGGEAAATIYGSLKGNDGNRSGSAIYCNPPNLRKECYFEVNNAGRVWWNSAEIGVPRNILSESEATASSRGNQNGADVSISGSTAERIYKLLTVQEKMSAGGNSKRKSGQNIQCTYRPAGSGGEGATYPELFLCTLSVTGEGAAVPVLGSEPEGLRTMNVQKGVQFDLNLPVSSSDSAWTDDMFTADGHRTGGCFATYQNLLGGEYQILCGKNGESGPHIVTFSESRIGGPVIRTIKYKFVY